MTRLAIRTIWLLSSILAAAACPGRAPPEAAPVVLPVAPLEPSVDKATRLNGITLGERISSRYSATM